MDTINHPKPLLALVAVVAGLLATTAAASARALPKNACTVLSAGEVRGALGSKPARTSPQRDSATQVSCTYTAPDGHVLSLTLAKIDPRQFKGTMNGGNVERVRGVGDAAFRMGDAIITGIRHDTQFTVTLAAAKGHTLPAVTSVAKRVAGRL